MILNKKQKKASSTILIEDSFHFNGHQNHDNAKNISKTQGSLKEVS